MKIFIHNSVFITKGYNRALLVDTQKNKIFYVPNSMADVFFNGFFDLSSKLYDEDSKLIIDQYISFLRDNHLSFETENENEVITLNGQDKYNFESPSIFDNCIIDVSSSCQQDYKSIFEGLTKARCKYLKLRYFEQGSLQSLIDMYELYIKNGRLRGVEIYWKYTSDITTKDLMKFLANSERIYKFVLYDYGAPNAPDNSYNPILYFSNIKSIDSSACGLIGHEFFALNLESYNLSKKYNSCLYKKVSIDKDGFIKNCPSLAKTFGRVESPDWIDVFKNKDFTSIWNINKDSIVKCKDCEYRFVCTDCRAYLDDPEDMKSAPLKCGYDPYTSTWSDWSQNSLKKKIDRSL